MSGVNLARSRDLLLRVSDHFLPLCQPADGTWDGKHHREHVRLESHGLVDDARIEVDVRIQLALDEVLIVERNLLQLHRNVDLRISPRDLEYLFGSALDDLRARIVV